MVHILARAFWHEKVATKESTNRLFVELEDWKQVQVRMVQFSSVTRLLSLRDSEQ